MARLKAVFVCQDCGHTESKWAGQCPDCGAWNTFVEEAVAVESKAASPSRTSPRPLVGFSSEVCKLSEVEGTEEKRWPTRLGELDRILGGGVVPGQVVLLAGPPGIGKSTLMLQMAQGLGQAGRGPVLYVTGEESLSQISGRSRRLGISSSSIYVLAETDLQKILEAIEKHAPGAILLDSVQTVYHPDFPGGPGSVTQVRECAAELLRAAKSRGAVLFLLGHVTKEGSVAGPKVLEHIVDTVLQFDTERRQLLRVLRATKNRFGPSSEVGIFEMRERGLGEVSDAASLFFEEQSGRPAPGRAVSVGMEGTRPMLCEVQALVVPTRYPLPRRMATGLDLNRVLVLIAAIEKHLHVRLESRDVFVNLAGGLRLRDPSLDLAVCMALLSSERGVPLAAEPGLVGEVGLLGGIGRVGFLGVRLAEAARAGFSSAVVSAGSLKDLDKGASKPGLRAQGAEDLTAAAALCFENPD